MGEPEGVPPGVPRGVPLGVPPGVLLGVPSSPDRWLPATDLAVIGVCGVILDISPRGSQKSKSAGLCCWRRSVALLIDAVRSIVGLSSVG